MREITKAYSPSLPQADAADSENGGFLQVSGGYDCESGKDTGKRLLDASDRGEQRTNSNRAVRALHPVDEWRKRLDDTIRHDGAVVFVDAIPAGMKVVAPAAPGRTKIN